MAGRESQIEQTLRSQGIAIDGLRVQDRGEVVSLYGSVADSADKTRAERVVEDTMKVKVANHLEARTADAASVGSPAASSTAIPTTSPAGSPALGLGYLVQSGDSLRKIAQRIYGDEMKWKRIWEANKAQIPNPDLIQPGMQLSIPPRE
jgi:nucleoid-associated protein YgaU